MCKCIAEARNQYSHEEYSPRICQTPPLPRKLVVPARAWRERGSMREEGFVNKNNFTYAYICKYALICT